MLSDSPPTSRVTSLDTIRYDTIRHDTTRRYTMDDISLDPKRDILVTSSEMDQVEKIGITSKLYIFINFIQFVPYQKEEEEEENEENEVDEGDGEEDL
ncbi:conserved Plasmodium protein, unknown function [Plasmodium ovale curtisi]|uniref:Uncharacterized protein n=1 Tax=Plasmodium ovale curtisi TaxID=864141 RepID=A0A1A8WBT9_PLAOA|nr:conserved Plasmodium protein, unknown function [Plasmodium ovale curtisi]